jgi:hypothetical protein
MRLEILYQFIVPLTFLAIWALTSLLNRDAQPLPPRPARGPGNDVRPGFAGSRVDPVGAGRYLGVQDRVSGAGSGGERPPSARWPETSQTGRPASVRMLGEDGITILDAEGRPARATTASAAASGASPAARAGRTGVSRRAARSRSGTSATPQKPIQQLTPRALTGLVTQSLAQKKARPLSIAPLSTPLTPLAAPLSETVAVPPAEAALIHAPAPAYSVEQLYAVLAAPAKLREIAVLSELLQPPRARRPWTPTR